MYITVTNYHINLAGWILFLISAIGFASLALVVIGRCLTAFFFSLCASYLWHHFPDGKTGLKTPLTTKKIRQNIKRIKE